MPTVRLYLVRHAESANNAKGNDDVSAPGAKRPCTEAAQETGAKKHKGGRAPDPPITAKGVEQASAAGEYLRFLSDESKTNKAVPAIKRIITSAIQRRYSNLGSLALGLTGGVRMGCIFEINFEVGLED